MRTILVTGATGTVGSEVVKQLVSSSSDHEVVRAAEPHYLEPFRILLCFDSFTIEGFTLGRDGGNAPTVVLALLAGVCSIGCPLAATPVTFTL